MNVKEWSEMGEMVAVGNLNVFVIDKGEGENTLFLLHGYATSSIDYYKVLPELSRHFRVILIDLVGFGFSDKPKDFHYSVVDQADIVLNLWRILELKNVTLLSHNLGTVIALEILTRKQKNFSNIALEKLIFLNSTVSFHEEYSPQEGTESLQDFSNRIRLMFSSYSFFNKKMKEFFYEEQVFDDEEVKARWVLAHHNNGREVIDFLANYSVESKLLWDRWFTAIEKNKLPSKIIVGKNDSVFKEVEAIYFAKELANSTLHFIENCGHYPMLEKPEEFVNFVLKA